MEKLGPTYFKELFIELKIRQAPSTKFFQLRNDDSALLGMISLYPKLDGDEYAKTAPDMDAKAELRDLDLGVMDDDEIKKKISEGMSDQTLLDDVEKLLDDELLVYGIDVKKIPKDVAATKKLFSQKVGMIVKFRVRDLNPISPIPRAENSFKCYVRILVGGWASLHKNIVLHFNYTDSFAHFVGQLQDVTRNCVVPPKNVERLEKAPNYNNPTSQEPIFRYRAPSETGYTLYDGPWIYRIADTTLNPDKSSRPYKPKMPIAWEQQYDAMKKELKDADEESKKGNFKKPHVLLTHSMDELAESNHKAELVRDEELENQFQETFKQVLIENEGKIKIGNWSVEDPGERYTDSMERDHHKERRAGRSRGTFSGGGDSDMSSTQSSFMSSSSRGVGKKQGSSPGLGNSSVTSQGNTSSGGTIQGSTST